jgi:MtN3 and saliva related transmembrane protein
MELTTVVGIAASVLTGASLLPQLIKIIREKKAQDISYLMLMVLFGGVGLWVWYGIRRNDWIIILSNGASVLLNLCIFAWSFYYRHR